MGLILEAFSPVDAVAIVRSGQQLRLCRPPYTQGSAIELPESAIEDAVLNHDFHASGAAFGDWAALIDFLNQELIAYRASCGRSVAEGLDNMALLNVAPLDVLQGFIEKVEKELIPQRQFAHAKNFLLALLGSNATQEHPDLKVKSVSLLKQIQQIEESRSNSATALANTYSLFPNLTGEGSRLAAYVQKNGFFAALERGHA